MGDLSDRARPASFVAEGVIVILVWSYLSARSAIFAASILRHGDSARFGRSWADASRLRLPLFLALAAIHTLLVAIQGMVYYSHPQLLDQSHLAVLVMYPPSAAFDAALTAGVFVVVFRRLAGSEAQVFD